MEHVRWGVAPEQNCPCETKGECERVGKGRDLAGKSDWLTQGCSVGSGGGHAWEGGSELIHGGCESQAQKCGLCPVDSATHQRQARRGGAWSFGSSIQVFEVESTARDPCITRR